jgi:hypothetical protein
MCPNDNSSMQTVQRGGVEFDMCPTCRGVWLDRGELEKLMNASRASDAEPSQREPERHVQQPRRDHDDDRYERRDQHRDQYRDQHYRKRRGFDLFDIFD